MRASRCCLVVMLLAVASALHAAETGSISGYVRADDGTALAGVTVSAAGDAFRAAGYSDDHARRYVTKIKSKIAEGLKLSAG